MFSFIFNTMIKLKIVPSLMQLKQNLGWDINQTKIELTFGLEYQAIDNIVLTLSEVYKANPKMY